MTEIGRTIQDDKGTLRPGSDGPETGPGEKGSRTSGTNRDFDESGEAANQGHGHAGTRAGDDAGHAETEVSEQDRQERDLGGPGG